MEPVDAFRSLSAASALPASPPTPRAISELQRRIRHRLADLGLTATAAARRVGGGPDLFRNVLRASGNYAPRSDTLRKIAMALEVSEQWLLTGQEEGVVYITEIDPFMHARVTRAALQSLETAGLELEPDHLSELILTLYAKARKGQAGKAEREEGARAD